MAFQIVEILGAVIGGFIAGIIGFGIAYYTHHSAVNDAKEAAGKAKKEAVDSYLVEIEYNQREIKRLISLVDPNKLSRSYIRFTRTIYSALADRLGELPCRDEIVYYYALLDRVESGLESPPNLKFEDLSELPLFSSIPRERLDEIMHTRHNRNAQFWAAVYEILKMIDAEGDELVECLVQETMAME